LDLARASPLVEDQEHTDIHPRIHRDQQFVSLGQVGRQLCGFAPLRSIPTSFITRVFLLDDLQGHTDLMQGLHVLTC
jgi:hypothetical protein